MHMGNRPTGNINHASKRAAVPWFQEFTTVAAVTSIEHAPNISL